MTVLSSDAARSLAGPSWLVEWRLAAFDRWSGTAPPTPSEELWRYSKIDSLDLDRYCLVAPGEGGPADVPRAPVVASGAAAATVECRDGRVVRAELEEALASKGVTVRSLASLDARPDALGRCAGSSPDWFVALNDAALVDGVVIEVPPGVVVEHPISVVHHAAQSGGMSMPRTLVVLGEGAELTLFEHHVSGDVDHLVSAVVELEVAQGATLDYVGFQDHADRVWHVALQRAHVTGGVLRSAAVALGGDYARTRVEALLDAPGASSDLVAVYFANETQMLDFRTLQDHVAPRTTSDLLFKGAVEDEGRSVYSGLVHIRPDAQGAAASQTNRNLVLSPGASAESIPNLEIEANDVKCSHASAVGPIDDDQLYYLASRGVPPEVAERLIVSGFFEDVIERLPVGSLADRLRAAVAGKFDARHG